MAVKKTTLPKGQKESARRSKPEGEARARGSEPRQARLFGTGHSVEDRTPEHTAYLHALTENNPLAIVVLDANFKIQMCNPAFEKMFGYHQAEILGAELDSLVAPNEHAADARDLTMRAAGGELVRATTRRRRSNGSLVDVQILGVPLVVNGKRIGSFG